jgi:hypothetical protein
MICSNCKSENEKNANFCPNCGDAVGNNVVDRKSNTRDVLVIAVLFVMFTSTAFWQFLKLLQIITGEYYYYDKFEYFLIFMNILYAGAPLLLALSLRKLKWKIVMLILACIYALIALYNTISPLFYTTPDFVNFEF